MHRSFIITEEERNRILGRHINATKKQYLSEQYDPNTQVLVVRGGGEPYVLFDKATKKAIKLSYGTNQDEKIRLYKNPIDNSQPYLSEGNKFLLDPIVKCQYDKIVQTGADNQSRRMLTPEEINQCLTSQKSVNAKIQPKKNTNVQSIQSKLKELGVELGKNANGYLNQQTLNAIYAQLDKIGTNTKTETPTTDNKTPVEDKKTETPTTDNKTPVEDKSTTGDKMAQGQKYDL